ncbi:NADH:flavin oxidoreductase/NADH oxidase [Coprinopsis sp. MPI-PUGE-AT-0042]|nr:NADH:flavin oxidoreductase/NADH oxidase [Coprinopsis sp. MPI-PUGE-AT-0042]
MGSISTSALFTPIKIGATQLEHRVVFAPCTRFRSTPETHIPLVPLVKTYYEQRASVPGTLIISEGTLIAEKASGMPSVPGIWSDEQINAWKEITGAVHAKKSFIFLQLWALGRAARSEYLHGHPYIGASSIRLSTAAADTPDPRPLTIPEIDEYVGLYTTAAKNAIAAGFDGVEVHSANGYLLDQFLQEVSNNRTDEYGGSIENRSRFGLRVVDAVAKAIGADKTGVRLSPWNDYQDMKMKNPFPQFEHFVSSLVSSHPDLAYVHFVEPEISGTVSVHAKEGETNDPFRKIWGSRPFISCGSYAREKAIKVAEDTGDIVAFGRAFIANPDLPFRLRENIELNTPDVSTFFTRGEKGYTDYPFAKEFTQE